MSGPAEPRASPHRRWIIREAGEPIDRRREPIARRGPSPLQAGLVVEFGPVVGVHDQGALIVDRVDLPAPQVPDRRLPGLSGLPHDEPALDELHHVILANHSSRERHAEDVADAMHPLSHRRRRPDCRCHPTRAVSHARISNQLEDPIRSSTHLARRNNDSVLGFGHVQQSHARHSAHGATSCTPPSGLGRRVAKSSRPTQVGRTAMRAWTVPGWSMPAIISGAASPRYRWADATYSGARPATSSICARPRMVRLQAANPPCRS